MRCRMKDENRDRPRRQRRLQKSREAKGRKKAGAATDPDGNGSCVETGICFVFCSDSKAPSALGRSNVERGWNCNQSTGSRQEEEQSDSATDVTG